MAMNTSLRDDPAPRARAPRGLGMLVFLAPFCLYLKTLAPTVYGLDSAELTAGAFTLGIVHSPGAPLYLLTAHLFTRLPIGDVGWRVNLLSAVCGSLSAVFVYATLRRRTGHPWIAVLGAWLLAASYYIWVWSVVAELYAVHLCISSALFWLLALWMESRRDRLLWAMAVVAGLGAGNHTSIILLAPGFAWVVGAHDRTLWRRPLFVLGLLSAAVLSLAAIFAYLPIRHAAHPAIDFVRDYFPDVNLYSPRGVWWMMRGGMFDHLFFQVPLDALGGRLRGLGRQLLANFGVLAVLLGLYGAGTGLARGGASRHWTIGCLLVFAGHSGFYLTYGALDSQWMYSVSYLTGAFFVAMGLSDLHDRWSSRPDHPARLILPGLAAVLVARLAWFNYPYVDLSNDTSARLTGERILEAMQPGALFIGLWEHAPILDYLQLVEGRRPDVRVINGVFIGPAGAGQRARAAHREDRPVYTTVTNLFDADVTFTYLPDGACYRVRPLETTSDTPLILP